MSKKYNLTQPLTRIDGEPILYGQLGTSGALAFPPPVDKAEEKTWMETPVPLWKLCQKSVLEARNIDDDGQQKDLTELEKFERYQLAQKLTGGEDLELTDAEVATIKKCVGTIWVAEIMGCVWTALEKPVKEGA